MPLGSRNSAFVLGIFVALVLIVTSMNAVVRQSGGPRLKGAVTDDGTEDSVSLEDGYSSDSWVYTPVCGDGYTDPDANEQCDDGNMENGDGCDVGCKFEDGWTEESSEAASEDFVESSEAASSEEMNSEESSESSSVQQSSMQTSSASSTTSSAHSSSRSAQECSSGYRCDVEPGAGGGGTCGHLQICPAGERPEVFGTCTELCSAYSAYMPILMDGECFRCVPDDVSSSVSSAMSECPTTHQLCGLPGSQPDAATCAPGQTIDMLMNTACLLDEVDGMQLRGHCYACIGGASSSVSSSRPPSSSAVSSSQSVCAACQEVCATTTAAATIETTETQESLWQDFLEYLFGFAPEPRSLTAQSQGGSPTCQNGQPVCATGTPGCSAMGELSCSNGQPICPFPQSPICDTEPYIGCPGSGPYGNDFCIYPADGPCGIDPADTCNEGWHAESVGGECKDHCSQSPPEFSPFGPSTVTYITGSCYRCVFDGSSSSSDAGSSTSSSSTSSSSSDDCQQCIEDFCAASSSTSSSSARSSSSASSSSSEGPCETDPDEPNACTLGGNSFCIDQGLGCVLTDDLPCATCEGLCGNHELDGEEECDDGNTKNNDGCSSTCELEDDFCELNGSSSSGGLSSVIASSSGSGEQYCCSIRPPSMACLPSWGTTCDGPIFGSSAECDNRCKYTCSDTDGGVNLTVTGTTTVITPYGTGPVSTDWCNSGNASQVYECQCETVPGFGQLNKCELNTCPAGTTCVNGACKAGAVCTDTDGNNILTFGRVILNTGNPLSSGQMDDRCSAGSTTHVQEMLCTSPSSSVVIVSVQQCPTGTSCSEGYCH